MKQKPLDISEVRERLFEDYGYRLAGYDSMSLSSGSIIVLEGVKIAFNNGLIGIVPRMYIYGDALKSVGTVHLPVILPERKIAVTPRKPK